MIEIALLGLILFSLLRLEKSRVLLLIVSIYPFHFFIKSLLFYFERGGNLFAFWKEFAAIILLYKIRGNINLKSIRPQMNLAFFYLLYVLVFFLIAENIGNGLASLRDQIFTILMFIVVYCWDFKSEGEFWKLQMAIVFGGLVSTLGGFLQHYFYNIQISTLKGVIDFIDDNGYIQYTTTSPKIMGMERMSGFYSGPNDFGLNMALIFSLCIVMLYGKSAKKGQNKPKYDYWILYLTVVASFACLLLSFSRAGWVITVVVIFVQVLTKNIKLNTRLILSFTITSIAIFFFIAFSFPKAFEIIENSFTGKEASASARSNVVNQGFEKVLSEPLGHGLGTTDHRFKEFEFFTESALINMSYEIGLIGILIFLMVHFLLLKRLLVNSDQSIASYGLGLSLASIIVSIASINTYGMPYIYLWWIFIGLGLNTSLRTVKFYNK